MFLALLTIVGAASLRKTVHHHKLVATGHDMPVEAAAPGPFQGEKVEPKSTPAPTPAPAIAQVAPASTEQTAKSVGTTLEAAGEGDLEELDKVLDHEGEHISSMENIVGHVIGELLLLGIFMYCCMGQRRAMYGQQASLEPGSVCACCHGPCPRSLCEVLCVAHYLWAENMGKIGALGGFWGAIGAMAGIFGVFVVAVVAGMPPQDAFGVAALIFIALRTYTRGMIREKHTGNAGSIGTKCVDCLISCCCHEPAAWQEAEYVEVYLEK